MPLDIAIVEDAYLQATEEFDAWLKEAEADFMAPENELLDALAALILDTNPDELEKLMQGGEDGRRNMA